MNTDWILFRFTNGEIGRCLLSGIDVGSEFLGVAGRHIDGGHFGTDARIQTKNLAPRLNEADAKVLFMEPKDKRGVK